MEHLGVRKYKHIIAFSEICANCGCTYGSHHGGTAPWPRDYCPGNEGRMDWEDGPGTVFKRKEEERNNV